MSSASTDSVVATSLSLCAVAFEKVCDDCALSAARSLACNGCGLLSSVALTLALLFGPVMRRAAGTMAVLACDNVGEGNEGRTRPVGAAGTNVGCEVSDVGVVCGLPCCVLLATSLSAGLN